MIGVSKTFESLQNNLPHFRNIKTLQLDSSVGRRSPPARGSQERYGSHYLPFMKALAGDGNSKVSTATQEEDCIKDNQEPCFPYDVATAVLKSSRLSQIIARDHEFNRLTPLKIYDGNKKVGRLINLLLFINDVNVLKLP